MQNIGYCLPNFHCCRHHCCQLGLMSMVLLGVLSVGVLLDQVQVCSAQFQSSIPGEHAEHTKI